MARYALPVVGAAIGAYFGGPQGAALGWSIGAAIGGVVDPQELPDVTREGNRLSDLQVTSSAYGTFIPITWGTVRTGGNIIWALPIIEDKNVEEEDVGGGKGGPTQEVTTVTYSYFATFAIAFGEGPADGVIRIWADSKLLYSIYDESDREATLTVTGNILGAGFTGFTFYPGDEEQLPDPLITADKGDLTPGHRGMCYIVFERLPLQQFGNRIPNITAEISFNGITRQVAAQHVDDEGPYNVSTSTINAVDWDRGRTYGFQGDTESMTRWDWNGGSPVLALTTESIIPDSVGGVIYVGLDFSKIAVVHKTDGFLYGTDNSQQLLQMSGDSLKVKGVVDYPDSWDSIDDDSVEIKFNTIITSTGQKIEYATLFGVASGTVNRPAYFMIVQLDTLGSFPGLLYVSEWGTDDLSIPSAVAPSENLAINSYMGMITRDLGGTTYYVYLLAGRGATSGLAPTYGTASTVWYVTRMEMAPLLGFALETTREVEFSINDLMTEFPELPWSDTPTPAVKNLIEFAWDYGDNSSFMFRMDIATEDTLTNEQTFYFKWDIDAKEWVWGSDDFSIYDGPSNIGWDGAKNSYIYNATYAVSNAGNSFKIYDSRTGKLREDISYLSDLGSSGVYNSQTGLFWVQGSGSPTDFGLIDIKGAVGDPVAVQTIINDITDKVGLSSGLYTEVTTEDVGSFQISRLAPARQSLTSLATAFNFDLIESDFGLKVVERGGASALNIPEDNLVAPVNADQETFTEQRASEVDLPMRVNVIVRDKDIDYQNRTQFIKRVQNPVKSGFSENVLSFAFPMTIDATKAKQITERLLFTAWSERISYAYALPQKYLANEPTDIVTVQTTTANFEQRLSQTSIGQDFTLDCLSIATDAAQYVPSTDAGINLGFRPPSLPGTDLTNYFLLDTPLLRDSDDVGRAADLHYHAAAGYGAGLWPGSIIYRSADNVDFIASEQILNEATWGTLQESLPDTVFPFTPDTSTKMTLVLVTGSVSSITDNELLNETKNVLAVFNADEDNIEIIQFRDVTSLGGNVYEISHLLRGRRGTDPNTLDHNSGEVCVLLSQATLRSLPVTLAEIGVNRFFKSVAFGADPAGIPGITQNSDGNTLKPYAPVQVEVSRDGGGDATITWERRTRILGQLLDGTGDVPLNEDSEEYEVDILNGTGTAVIHTVTGITSKSTVITNATLVSLGFASDAPEMRIQVYQVSAQVGRGFPSYNIPYQIDYV